MFKPVSKSINNMIFFIINIYKFFNFFMTKLQIYTMEFPGVLLVFSILNIFVQIYVACFKVISVRYPMRIKSTRELIIFQISLLTTAPWQGSSQTHFKDYYCYNFILFESIIIFLSNPFKAAISINILLLKNNFIHFCKYHLL